MYGVFLLGGEVVTQQYVEQNELTLARAAGAGDSGAGAELLVRIKKCIAFLIRQHQWGDLISGDQREEDLPSEVAMRLLLRVRRGFDGAPEQFRTYLYRTVASVCSEAAGREMESRRKEVSLQQTVESDDGGTTTLEDLIANQIAPTWETAVRAAAQEPERALMRQEEAGDVRRAFDQLDLRCQVLVREITIEGRRHADVAVQYRMSVQNVDVSIRRCMERFYRALLYLYAHGAESEKRRTIGAGIERLPEPQRAVFRAWWEGRSVKQTAQVLALPEEDVRRQLCRARATLWTLLSEGARLGV
jgi:RNA polymerase sigma factor (sigma-70 family)